MKKENLIKIYYILDTIYIKIGFVVTLAISFFNDINVIPVNKFLTYGILIFWICVAGLIFYIDASKRKKLKNLKYFLLGNLTVKILIYLYTIFLIIFGFTERRFFSSNMQTFVNAISAVAIVFIFEEAALIYSIYAMCLTFICAFIYTVGTYGLDFFSKLEFHDLAFCGGYILIYLLFASKQWIKKNSYFILLVTVIIIIAFKRIGIVALLFTIGYYFIIEGFKNKDKRKILHVSGYIAIIISYVFVFLVISGGFVQIINIIGDFTSGRYYYYQIAKNICQFNPFYLGIGRNAVAVLFSQEYSYFSVGNIHSDILRMYIECGFLFFGVWLLNYFVFLPRIIEKKFGLKSCELFLLCTVYNFIIYLTDNTELYIGNQYFYMLIPIVYAMKDELKTKV